VFIGGKHKLFAGPQGWLGCVPAESDFSGPIQPVTPL
jgi:hypothetical protein